MANREQRAWHPARSEPRTGGAGLARLAPMRADRRLLLVVPAVLMLLACHRGPPPLAEVGGRAITVDDLAGAVAAQTGRPLAETSPELQAALFEAYLEEEVLLASSTIPGDRALPPAQRSARCRDLLASLCVPPPPPSEAEVGALLAQRGGAGTGSERIHLRQLVLPDQAGAQKARERVRQGEDFATLSREISRAPNAASGGVIGWVERGQLPPEFEAATFSLAAGAVSPPVQSNAGWHVFQVIERRSGGADEEARNAARDELVGRASEAARRKCLRDLAGKVSVRVNCQSAPFPCRNPFEDAQ
jgi:hypothetical protein